AAGRRSKVSVSSPARPVRVLHLIDGLAGGGSERWIWDLVRLRDPRRVEPRVVTIHPDLGRFVYAERLRQAGAYGAHRRSSSLQASEVPSRPGAPSMRGSLP